MHENMYPPAWCHPLPLCFTSSTVAQTRPHIALHQFPCKELPLCTAQIPGTLRGEPGKVGCVLPGSWIMVELKNAGLLEGTPPCVCFCSSLALLAPSVPHCMLILCSCGRCLGSGPWVWCYTRSPVRPSCMNRMLMICVRHSMALSLVMSLCQT